MTTQQEQQGWGWGDEHILPSTRVALAILGGGRTDARLHSSAILDSAVEAFGISPDTAVHDLLGATLERKREALVRNLRYLPKETLGTTITQIGELSGRLSSPTSVVGVIVDEVLTSIHDFDVENDQEIHDKVIPNLGYLVTCAMTNQRGNQFNEANW